MLVVVLKVVFNKNNRFCIDVKDPEAEANVAWPADTSDCCFVIHTKNRDFFLVAESAEEKK